VLAACSRAVRAVYIVEEKMILAFLISWAILAVAFAITSWLVPGMDVSGGVWGYIWVSALFGIVNAIIGTFLRILTLPLTLVTLGLFGLIVNAILLSITDWLTGHLTIDEFWWTAVWAAIVLALVGIIISVFVALLSTPREERRQALTH
jgi:putative membrane protein